MSRIPHRALQSGCFIKNPDLSVNEHRRSRAFATYIWSKDIPWACTMAPKIHSDYTTPPEKVPYKVQLYKNNVNDPVAWADYFDRIGITE